MSNGEAYWSLLEPVAEAISIYDGPAQFFRQFHAAPVPARNLFAAHWCQSEVCNGGFYQFFANSTGVLAPEAVTAFQAIGMPQLSAVVASAAAQLGSTYPRERDARCAVLSAHPELVLAFGELEREFYSLLQADGGGFSNAADAYAQENSG